MQNRKKKKKYVGIETKWKNMSKEFQVMVYIFYTIEIFENADEELEHSK